MCDYSLMHCKSRPAKVGDELTSGKIVGGDYEEYPSVTRGVFEAKQPDTAVCLIPGTEVAFAQKPVKFLWMSFKRSKVATFTQVNKDNPMTHHDALEFADGEVRLIHDLQEGQKMTVLQMPAKPQTEGEAKAQERLAVSA